eukprot:CAMPEP_0113322318 /NCGR_PEP_ID=MMETSP0010_2-20120614/15529_1 /TAXON_ID=216773 ORGANISM="Corethron hystrix, Strain 308" /NCGR_SAMPLE_ID=MMETSP0010_2 /ASSEMBLY_ACC=CAM_ASM_000155 /LENGTH=232 /DNA_ID=CAMNT_0000180785 /DNA_START=630 /DNA_END=1325 /DNA_ORIENTATION=- /assembly_acc=CAM_ASM_000155
MVILLACIGSGLFVFGIIFVVGVSRMQKKPIEQKTSNLYENNDIDAPQNADEMEEAPLPEANATPAVPVGMDNEFRILTQLESKLADSNNLFLSGDTIGAEDIYNFELVGKIPPSKVTRFTYVNSWYERIKLCPSRRSPQKTRPKKRPAQNGISDHDYGQTLPIEHRRRHPRKRVSPRKVSPPKTSPRRVSALRGNAYGKNKNTSLLNGNAYERDKKGARHRHHISNDSDFI